MGDPIPSEPTSDGGYDPNTDPSNWLGTHGFRWKRGNGAYAIWIAPNGQEMSQQSAIALARQIETQQPQESSKLGDTVNIGDRVKQWNPKTGTYDIDLGSSQAPPQYAPRYPEGGVVGNRTYRTDPYTGEVTFGEAVPGTLSPEQQRANDVADALAQRTFTSGENATTRAASAAESAAQRAARAAEFATTYGQDEAQFGANYGRGAASDANAYNQNEAQFGATYGRGAANDENAYNQYIAGFQRQQQQDQLAGAEQYSRLVSQVDPAALPAFHEAGGGNIMNAVAAGRDALSSNALLPAARTLRGLENPAQPAGFVRAPAYTPAPYQAAPAYTPRPYAPPPVAPQAPPTPTAPPTQEQNNAAAIAAGATPGGQYAPGWTPGPVWRPSPGPPIAAANGFSGVVDRPTPIVAGESGPENVQITPIDTPYMDRVRQFRQQVDVRPPIEGGYMNVGFSNIAPSLQQRYTAGLQSRYGVPQGDVQAEQRRYALRGFQQPYSVGY